MTADYGNHSVLALLAVIVAVFMVGKLLANWRRSWRRWRYRRLLRDPEWIKFRRGYYTRHPYRCAICESARYCELHHKAYVIGLLPWEYPDKLLEPRCRKHHPRGAPTFWSVDQALRVMR